MSSPVLGRFKNMVGNSLRGRGGKSAEALEAWRKWLWGGDNRALETFYGHTLEGSYVTVGEETRFASRNIDFSDISIREWERFVDLGLLELESINKGANRRLLEDAMTVAVIRGIGRYKGDDLPFLIWFNLWRISRRSALAILDKHGYHMVVPMDFAEKEDRGTEKALKAEGARIGVEGVLAWTRDRNNRPIAKRVALSATEDVKPLLAAQDKESRMLAIKLLGGMKKEGVSKDLARSASNV